MEYSALFSKVWNELAFPKERRLHKKSWSHCQDLLCADMLLFAEMSLLADKNIHFLLQVLSTTNLLLDGLKSKHVSQV